MKIKSITQNLVYINFWRSKNQLHRRIKNQKISIFFSSRNYLFSLTADSNIFNRFFQNHFFLNKFIWPIRFRFCNIITTDYCLCYTIYDNDGNCLVWCGLSIQILEDQSWIFFFFFKDLKKKINNENCSF